MKPFIPYLRVLAGFVAAVSVWTSIVSLVHGDVGAGIAGLLIGAGLAYLAIGQPLRDRRARRREQDAAIAARADAAYAADLRGDTVLPPPPPPVQPPKLSKGVVIAIVVATALFLIGVVSDLTDGDQESDPASMPPTTSAQPSPAPMRVGAAHVAATATAAPTTTAEAALTTGAMPATSVAAVAADMPNVLCMNLQDAQDLIQEQSVFYSRSRDATGEGRHQILDRDWVVVQQSPSPGTPFGEGDAVLSVVKYGEPNECG